MDLHHILQDDNQRDWGYRLWTLRKFLPRFFIFKENVMVRYEFCVFFPMAMAVGIIFLPIRDMKSVTLSSALNLIISKPETKNYSLSSLRTKFVLPSKLKLS